MIKANELRIGNYAQDDNGRVGYVTSISKKIVKLKLSHSTLTIKIDPRVVGLDIEPIQLTEDWLLNFGFTNYEWCSDCAFIRFNHSYMMLRFYSNKWHCTKTTVSTDS